MVINKTTLVKIYMFLVFVALLEPRFFYSQPIHAFFRIGRYFGLFSSLFIFVKYKFYREIPVLLMLGHVICMGVSTLLYSGRLNQGYLFMVITLLSIIVSSLYCIRKFPKSFVLYIAFIFSVWIFTSGIMADGLSFVTDERGSVMLFLGTKTTITYHVVPAMAFNFIAYHIVPKRKLFFAKVNIMLFIAGIFLYLRTINISTCIICLVLGVILAWAIPKYKLIAQNIYWFGFWITSIINVLFITGASMSIFFQFAKDILGEREGLNGRTEIWKQVLRHISNRPIMGHGFSSNIIFDAFTNFNTSTHNYFLHLLFTTGIVGFFVYIAYIIYVHKKNREYIGYPIVGYLFAILMLMNIEGITESYGFNEMTFLVLVLLGYANEIIELQER